jgi:ankyrin repeat protein
MSYTKQLWEAVANSDYSQVRFLLDRGLAPVNMVDEQGDNLLFEAIIGDDFDMIELLLQRGINVHGAGNGSTTTPLEEAALFASVPAATILIKHGAFVNRCRSDSTRKRLSPLARAIKSVHLDRAVAADAAAQLQMVQLLIHHGADVCECNYKGRTLLMSAAGYGDADVVRALLNAGADPEARDVHGDTAIHYAEKGGHIHIKTILLEAICRRESSVAFAMGSLPGAGREGRESLLLPLDRDLVSLILRDYNDM